MLFRLILRNHRDLIVFIILMGISLAFLLGQKSAPNKTIESYLRNVTDILEAGFNGIINVFPKDETETQAENLEEKYKLLLAENKKLQLRIIDYEKLQQDLKLCRLEHQHEELYNPISNNIPAKVNVMRTATGERLNISRGKMDQVEKGMPVLAQLDETNTAGHAVLDQEGLPRVALVGYVSETYTWGSVVIPLTSGEFETNGYITISSVEQGGFPYTEHCIIVGNKKGAMDYAIARHMEKDNQIKVGEEVYTSGGNCSRYPSHILVGKISERIEEGSTVGQDEFKIETAVNLNTLKVVLVVPTQVDDQPCKEFFAE